MHRFTLLFACVALGIVLLTASAYAQDNDPATVPPAQAALRINEFMASNQSFAIDPVQPESQPDWVEIYNPGAAPVDLKGLSISDDPNNPAKNPITQTVMVPAGGFVLLFAGEDSNGRPLSPRHFAFGLSAGGESVGLYLTATGEVVDEHEFGAQAEDISEGRIPDGGATWRAFATPTPGESNAKLAPTVVSVQRSIAQPQAGQSVTVTAVITDDGSVVSASLVYTAAPASPATLPMANVGGNNWRATIPAFANNTFVAYHVQATNDLSNTAHSALDGYVVGYVAPTLRINEFMAENFGLVEDEDNPGEFPDWLEIYNPTSAAIPLGGLYLSDNARTPTVFPIPNSLSVPAKGFILFWLDNDPEQGPNHTNFSLSKDGEFIGLYGAFGTVLIDGLTFGKQNDNVAMGRFPDGAGSANDAASFVALVCPTPKKANLLCDQKNYMPAVKVLPVP